MADGAILFIISEGSRRLDKGNVKKPSLRIK
jgi:hypothetical protein